MFCGAACHYVSNISNISRIKLLQGLYQKAETMYAMGDFEYALVFYHRGDKIRPDIKAFKLGIQKAQEAINNSIGCEFNEYCSHYASPLSLF